MSSTVFPIKSGAVPQSQWTLDQGVDIAAPGGSPLLAVESGVVKYLDLSGFDNGKPTVPVLYGDSGHVYYYGHADAAGELKSDTKVNAGDQIGEVGRGIVGKSTGPHLEIGLASSAGAPLGPQSAMSMEAILKGADPGSTAGAASSGSSSSSSDGGGGGLSLNPADWPGEILSWLKGAGVKALLYLVLVAGGMVLAWLGIKRTFGG